MAGVYCNVYCSSAKPDRIKLNGFSLNETISFLKTEISKQTTIPTEELAVIYCGRCLSDYATLESCGVKNGRTLHLLRKPNQGNASASQEKIDSSELGLQRLVMALKTAIRNPAYRSTVQRLAKPEVLENIIAATPGLSEDPIAIAILQDPDLLMQFTDVATIHRVVETHPALAEAINHIVAAVHEDSTTQRGAAGQQAAAASAIPGAYAYLLDALSDEDDEGESPPDSSQGSANPSRGPEELVQSPFAAITPAQLASALAAVATAGSSTPQAVASMDTSDASSPAITPRILWDTAGPFGSAGGAAGASTSTSQPAATVTASSSGIANAAAAAFSPEFVNQAMQRALGAASMNQLQQLRDMGIMDDAVSLRALQITGGNVQAALELIFGDATGSFNPNSAF